MSMQSPMNPMMYPPGGPGGRPPRRIGRLIVILVLVAMVGFWVAQTLRRGAFSANPAGMTMVRDTRPANGERDVLVNTYISAYLNAGHALDPHTVDTQTVKLYRSSDQKPVPAQVNTSAAGDDIVLTPIQPLEPSTQYTFEVKG